MIALGGTVAAGGLFVRRRMAKAKVQRDFMAAASSQLDDVARAWESVPSQAGEQIKMFFHGKCLNVHAFVDLLCSTQFTNRLGRCENQEQRAGVFAEVFCTNLVAKAELDAKLLQIADEANNKMYSAWENGCTTLTAQWNTALGSSGSPIGPRELLDDANELLGEAYTNEASALSATSLVPSIKVTVDKIYQAGLLMLPYSKIKMSPQGASLHWLVIPEFLFAAFDAIWDYISARLDNRRGEFQTEISSSLAECGIKVALQFEKAMKSRLLSMERWQSGAIDQLASNYSKTRVGWL